MTESNDGLPCPGDCQLTKFPMKTESIQRGRGLAIALLLFSLHLLLGADSIIKTPETDALPLIKLAVSTDTGLLLELPFGRVQWESEV